MKTGNAERPRGWPTWQVVLACAVAATAGFTVARWPHAAIRPTDAAASPPPAAAFVRVRPGTDSAAAANGGASAVPARIGQDQTDLLARLAMRDPQAALAHANAENNRVRRKAWLEAVLRGWALSDPEAAAEWALAQRKALRTDALAAVLRGTADHPDATARIAARAIARDPAHAAEYGEALLRVLADAGAHSAAVQFVEESAATPLRDEQMNTAFANWARSDPAAAAAALAQVTAPDLRADAWRGLTVGWAEADPVGLANYAARMPAGEARAQALANALPRWVDEDPVAAASWIARQEPGPDFDLGVIAVASVPGLVADRPQLALNLAEGISDPALRTNTVRTLALKWAERDPVSASTYVQQTTQLSPDDRQLLLGEIRAGGG